MSQDEVNTYTSARHHGGDRCHFGRWYICLWHDHLGMELGGMDPCEVSQTRGKPYSYSNSNKQSQEIY